MNQDWVSIVRASWPPSDALAENHAIKQRPLFANNHRLQEVTQHEGTPLHHEVRVNMYQQGLIAHRARNSFRHF